MSTEPQIRALDQGQGSRTPSLMMTLVAIRGILRLRRILRSNRFWRAIDVCVAIPVTWFANTVAGLFKP